MGIDGEEALLVTHRTTVPRVSLVIAGVNTLTSCGVPAFAGDEYARHTAFQFRPHVLLSGSQLCVLDLWRARSRGNDLFVHHQVRWSPAPQLMVVDINAALRPSQQVTMGSLCQRENVVPCEAGIHLLPVCAAVMRDEHATEFLVVDHVCIDRV